MRRVLRVKVLAIDPGPHVGVARWIRDEYGELWAEEEATPLELYHRAADSISWADEVVCEDFIIGGARAKSANVTIEMIGVLRYLCAQAGRPFTTQAPGDAKNFSTNTKLKNLGWYKPAAADHARSATRHLVLYLAAKGRLSADRLLASTQEVD